MVPNMNSNTKYLECVISKYRDLDELTLLAPIAIYDLSQVVAFSSKQYKQVRGVQANEGSSGLPDELGQYFKSQSLKEQEDIISTKTSSYSINFNYYDGIVQPYTTYKKPLINPDNDEAVGLYVELRKILYTNLKFSILKALNVYDFSVNTNFKKYNLSKREKQVIFLFIHGLTSQEIASVISTAEKKTISKSAIDAVFANQLRIKFDVYTRDGLYDKLINLGFYQVIPQDLMVNIKLPAGHIDVY